MTDSTNAKLRELRERVAARGFALMVIALFLSIIEPHVGWAALGIIGGFM